MQNTDSFNSFSFEINLANLLGIVEHPKIILSDDQDSEPILLKKDYKTNGYNLEEVRSKVLDSVKHYASLNALGSKGNYLISPQSNLREKLTTEEEFEAWVCDKLKLKFQ